MVFCLQLHQTSNYIQPFHELVYGILGTALSSLCHLSTQEILSVASYCTTNSSLSYKAYFLKDSALEQELCTTESVFLWLCQHKTIHFSPFLYFNHHIKPFCKSAISQSLQTREFRQCSQYEIMLPTSSLSLPYRVQPII